MRSLTDGCAILGFDGSLPWPLCKVTLPVVHYGPIVIGNAEAVDSSVTIFSEVVLLV